MLFCSLKGSLFLSKPVTLNRNKVVLFQSKCVHAWEPFLQLKCNTHTHTHKHIPSLNPY